MRYRKLTAAGDYSVDPSAAWLVNSPATVAQAVQTKLRLFAGEWFLDADEGLRAQRILGNQTQGTRDIEIKRRILETPGVTEIAAYASQVDTATRKFSVSATLNTVYGAAAVTIMEAF